MHHGLTKKIDEWKYDSYSIILSDKPAALQREAVINWFGSRERFIEFHKQPVNIKNFDLEQKNKPIRFCSYSFCKSI